MRARTLCRLALLMGLSFGLLQPARAGGDTLLDINAATPAQLLALPGMGREYVRRVIAGRPYRAKNDLSRRGVLPAEEYQRIAPLIVAHRMGTAGR